MTTANKVKQLILDLASLDPEAVERIDVNILLRGKAGTVTLTVSPAISVPTMEHVNSSTRDPGKCPHGRVRLECAVCLAWQEYNRKQGK